MKIYHVLFTLMTVVIVQTSCQKDSFVLNDGVKEELNQPLLSTTAGSCGQLKTHSPGGWGADPSGDNPGSYLHANFANSFNVVTIGCYEGFSVTLTSAQSITDLLPAGGIPAALNETSIDPVYISNSLVSHLVSLTLSVGVDYYDPNFADAQMNLGDMIINSGPFQGSSVKDFLFTANQVIGGCNSFYSIQDVMQTSAQINRNYLNGVTDNGFLKCPETTPR